MDYNLLLTYLTEVGGERWELFKNACQTLAQAVDEEEIDRGTTIWNIAQRNLSRLGHVEFQFGERSIWRVAPPALVSVPQEDEPKAILCGARNPPFLDRVREASGALGKELRIYSQPEGPDVVVVNDCSPRDAQILAEKLNISYGGTAARLFACLPSLDDMLELCHEENSPIGWRVDRFDVESLKWEQASQTAGAGLYRYSSQWQPNEYRLLVNGGKFLKVPPFVGIYHLLRVAGKQALFYDSQRRILSVRASAKMPELYERAATLCSGFLPVFDSSNWRDKFRDAPRQYAEVAAIKLSQPLEGW